MSSANDYQGSRRNLARRFLLTAVVVDDEGYIDSAGILEQDLTPPSRYTQSLEPDEDETQTVAYRDLMHRLNAGALMASFSRLGIVCSVVSPDATTKEVLKQTDIVILDWLLRNNENEYALTLLRQSVGGEENENSLRLVAIYTGEDQLEKICDEVVEELDLAGLDPKKDETQTMISYRYGLVVLYAKSGVKLTDTLENRSVEETELPDRLVDDFASMTSGLLPGIALASLTAVREGSHKVLDQFSADLDPAFLTHRACLMHPDDAERQLVNHVAEEFRGLMDYAVAQDSPAGPDAVAGWIQEKGNLTSDFEFGNSHLSIDETIALANDGLKKSQRLNDNAFNGLTAGFSMDGHANLDERLSWIMSFRTVAGGPPPFMWLGSVVTKHSNDDECHLICLRPRCGCVRLTEVTPFFFLPLIAPKRDIPQIVIRLDEDFERLGIESGLESGVIRSFVPSTENGSVTAMEVSPGKFEFEDTGGISYTWRGELKAEYAQRLAQDLASNLSRVAVDESEWLRRMIRKGG